MRIMGRMTLITNGADSVHWLRLRAKCLALASVLAILGAVPGHGAEAARPGIAECSPGAGCTAPPTRGVTVYRGLVLDYEVIDGMAVHGGDIVLGTAAEAAAAAPSREPAEPERSAGPARRDAHAVQHLWPGGKVPYEIDARIEGEDLEVIHAALEEWNSKTVIEFFPRTDEPQYALLVPVPAGVNCSSGLGPGSPTTVNTGGCPLGSTIHELGHAVGLLHEQQRPDRDEFLAVAPLYYSVGMRGFWHVPQWTHVDERAARLGPYDYGSNMHYGQVPRNVTTMPPGIKFFGAPPGLSAGDIDGVARLYGTPPTTITIETNPTGHDVIVDGERVTAPAVFDWLPDSVHTLEAPLLQPGTRGRNMQYVFGRWSDGGGRRRTVRASPDATWFEANLIPLEETRPGVHPAGAGTVALSPGSPDGRYARGVQIELTPVQAAGTPYEFARWSNWQTLLPHGPVLRHEVHGFQNDAQCCVRAHFREPPLYWIRANIEGLRLPLDVNGARWLTPAAFQPAELPAGSKVSVPEFVPVQESLGSGGRYRFSGWSDGGEREHEIAAPAEGGALTVQVQREFELDARADRSGGIEVSPASEDGFYASGTQVQLTAIPPEGQYFVGWEHDVSGTATTQFVIMDRDRRASAKFARVEPIRVPSGEPLQADSLDGRHFVRVPDGTSEVAVRFESSATVRDAEFYVTDNSSRRRELGRTRLGESDTITLTREALSRMRNRARARPDYESHHLRIWQRSTGWSGTLHVTIQRDWIAGVWPPAFTFVSAAGRSDPIGQTLRIAPVEGELPPVRYRIVSDSHWLEAFPPEWTGAQGEAEIAVTANGAALGAEAYGGKLKIQIARDGDPAAGWTPTGIEIPIHFVVKPSDGEEEPTGDGSSGLAGGDDHGDTREAATELAAGAAARGRLERVGDEDWFRFRTTAARTWIAAYTDSEGDTTGELHVAGSDSPLADDDAGSGANFRIAASVPAGTHYLRVRGFGTADYALALEAVPDDHGDTRETATEVAVGAAARGRLQLVGDEDWFQFRTTAARTWITAYTVSDGGMSGELHVAGGGTVANDDAGSGANFWIAAAVPAGTHYLRVRGSSTADYALTLKETLDAMEFVRIPAGSFVMGSPEDEEGRQNNETQHEVTLSQGFWMGKHEVTQAEWEALMGSNPSLFNRCGSRCPVEQVSWEDVQEFIQKLNERESGKGYRYRLPTEAEWEYAARAGTTGARYGELDEIVWLKRDRTYPVGQKRANAWGLHDMLGNVAEWTADWDGEYPASRVVDPQGPATGSYRVVPGSAVLHSWKGRAEKLRSANRERSRPGHRYRYRGFRLVRTN